MMGNGSEIYSRWECVLSWGFPCGCRKGILHVLRAFLTERKWAGMVPDLGC